MAKSPNHILRPDGFDPHTALGNPHGLPIARCYIRVSDTHGRDSRKYRTQDTTKPVPTVPPRYRGELLSPDVQLESARRYCREKGYWLDEVASLRHIDLDQSGWRKHWTKRPGIVAHLDAAKRGDINCIVFYKSTRIGRNTRDGLEIWDAFEATGTTIAIAEERVDTTTASGRMIRTILLSVGQFQAENVSDDVKGAIQERAASGRVWGRTPAWLWKDADGQEYVHPAAAAAIRRMVELRCIPLSYRKVTRTLNEEGHRRPEVQSAGIDPHRLWTERAVQYHLSHEVIWSMRGHSVYGRERADDDPERIELRDVHPPILTTEEADRLDAVQATLAEAPLMSTLPSFGWGVVPARRVAGTTRSASTSFLLSGILFCALCGAKMRGTTAGNRGKDTVRNYHCLDGGAQAQIHRPVDLGAMSGNTCINAEMIEASVQQALKAAMGPVLTSLQSGDAVPAAGAVTASAGGRRTGRRPKPDEPRTLADIASAVSRLQDGYERSLYTIDEYSARLKVLRVEEQDRRDFDAMERIELLMTPDLARVVSDAGITKNTAPSPETIRMMIRALVERVELPHFIPGRKVYGGRNPDMLPDVRFARVVLKRGLLDQFGVVAILAEVRKNTWEGLRPPVVWEMTDGTRLQEVPDALLPLIDPDILREVAAPMESVLPVYKGTGPTSGGQIILRVVGELREAIVKALELGATNSRIEEITGVGHKRLKKLRAEIGIPDFARYEQSKVDVEQLEALLRPVTERAIAAKKIELAAYHEKVEKRLRLRSS